MRGSKIYWFMMFIDIMFIVAIRYIYKHYDSDTYWFSLATLSLYRITSLWVCIIFNRQEVKFKWWEWLTFGIYLIVLVVDSTIWTVKTSHVVWP